MNTFAAPVPDTMYTSLNLHVKTAKKQEGQRILISVSILSNRKHVQDIKEI